MWASSFNDLAKKAAEMQEQAAASITSPAASNFSMGSMFNMDSLQQQEESDPDKKAEDLKKLAHSTMARADAGRVTSAGATFYNPLASVTTTAFATPQKQQAVPASRLQQTKGTTPSATFKSKQTNHSNGSTRAITPSNMTSALSFGNNTATTKTTTTITPVKIQTNKPLLESKVVASVPQPKKQQQQQPATERSKKSGLVIGGTKKAFTGPNTKIPSASLATPGKPKLVVKATLSSATPLPSTTSKLIPPSPPRTRDNLSKPANVHTPLAKQPPQSLPTPKPQMAKPKQTHSTLESAVQPKPNTSNETTKTTIKPALNPSTSQATAADEKSTEPQPPKQEAETGVPPGQKSSQKEDKVGAFPPETSDADSQTKDGNSSDKKTEAPTSDIAIANISPKKETIPEPTVSSDSSDATDRKETKDSEPIREEKEQPISHDNLAATETESQSVPPPAMGGEEEQNLNPAVSQAARNEALKKQLEVQRRETEERIKQLRDEFTKQLHRLEENHQAENTNVSKQYELSLAHLQSEADEREGRLLAQSKEVESQKQAMALKLESVSAKLKQAKELIADKDKQSRILQEKHLQQLRGMEKEFFRSEDDSNALGQEIVDLKKQLKDSKNETKTALDDYNTLKERARGVAGELKGKRAECRTLTSEINLLKDNTKNLQERITQLEARGIDLNQSSEETQEKLAALQVSLEDKEKELKECKEAIESERTNGAESLAAYKKKAQQSLAMANARSASAVQAREEAEMEARAARSTADSAMQRAMDAEMKGKRALAEAKQYTDEMKDEVAEYETVKKKLEDSKNELKTTREELETQKDSTERLHCELTSLSGRLEAEQQTMEDLKTSLSNEQSRSNELYEEVERLRREGQRSQDEIRRLSDANKKELSSSADEQAIVRGRSAEAEATIAILQQELQDANRAIKDLKETLNATIKENDALHSSSSNLNPHYAKNGGASTNGHQGNGMPLFYAMEKQAELSQAREEIARLASLVGDAESTKQEALEHMHEMKRAMEEAQSRLKRQEQLKQNPETESVNLEYLKNIVLSYLNASTVQEKKALLPVIGTVLCLTHEEQAAATAQLNNSKVSVMDSVASSVLNLKW